MTAERESGDFGSRLRDARERKGVSLRTIANETKISMASLEALERNDISRLPGGIFSRAFVRAFAAEVGLDREATVEDFVRQFPHQSVTDGHPPSTRVDDSEAFESNRRAASLGLKLLAAALPIAILVVYFGMTSRQAPLGSVRISTPAAASAEASSGGRTSGEFARADRLRVEVVATRACALSSAVDGQAPTSLPMEAVGRRNFDVGRDLLLTVSDAGAVEWSINGVPGRALGPSGEPATIHLTIENYREFLDVR